MLLGYNVSLYKRYTNSTSVSILQISPKNHNCKHEKLKDGSKSSQISSFKFVSTILHFHIKIIFNYSLQMCSMSEGLRNKYTPEKARVQSD